MPTNKIVLKTQEEFMSGFKPLYNPIASLLLGRSQAYSEEVGKINFNKLSAVGDIRAHRITPKDTEMRQISVNNSAKSFKKYFFGNQYIQSLLQAREDIEGIVAQVLDEHNRQFDDLVFLGEGTSASNMVNNSLFWSNDPNYRLEASSEIAASTAMAADYYSTFMSFLDLARARSGRKAIMVYGSTALSNLNSLFPDTTDSVLSVLKGNLESDETIIRVPSDVNLGNVNGWIAVNLDAVKLHYTTLPKLDDQGVNTEKKYSWHNFLMGSAMVEVEQDDGIVRQPITFA